MFSVARARAREAQNCDKSPPLNRGSRSTCMSKTKPSGQAGSARRSATVFAVTGTSLSISTLMLSR
jgi:hypothetical protein